MKFKNKIIVFFFIVFSNFFFSNSYSADKLKKFIITGNDRVSDETIIMFSNLEIGQSINDNILNSLIKELYNTNYFKNIYVSSNNGILKIEVDENPIIQKVVINGVEDNKIYDNIKEITSKIEKYPFVETKIKEQTQLLKNILKTYGYYFVKLNTFYDENNNNTIDLIYNFDLGEIAKIKKNNIYWK